MRIALAQHRAGSDRAESLERAVAALRAAAEAGAELVAFPELAIDRFFPCCRGDASARELAEPVPGPTTDRLAAVARELGVVVVFNLYERDGEGRCYDSSPVIDADGTLLGVTRMLHITDYEGFHEQDYYHPGMRRGRGAGRSTRPARAGWGWRSATTGTSRRRCGRWGWRGRSWW